MELPLSAFGGKTAVEVTKEGQQVQNLLSMTPHVYRIGKEGAQRLRQTQMLTDTASCVLNLYIPVKD